MMAMHNLRMKSNELRYKRAMEKVECEYAKTMADFVIKQRQGEIINKP